MEMLLLNDRVRIELRLLEKILSCHGNFEFAYHDIKQIHQQIPASSWRDLRIPGTLFPGVIKAGTYYTARGKEFWYVTSEKNPFVIELKHHSYKRIILSTKDTNHWVRLLRTRL